MSFASDSFIKATIFDLSLLRRRVCLRARCNVIANVCSVPNCNGCGALVRPASTQQDAVLPPPVPRHALRTAAVAAAAAEDSSSIPLLGAVGVRPARRQALPLIPVAEAAVEHRLEGAVELGEGAVRRQAEGVDEVDLHRREPVHLVPVHAVDRLHLELGLLEVALEEELVGDEFRDLLLDRPRLRDGGQVARGHHHPPEERAVLVVAPVERVVVDDGESLGPAFEVDGEVGCEDCVLQNDYHTFEFFLEMQTISILHGGGGI